MFRDNKDIDMSVDKKSRIHSAFNNYTFLDGHVEKINDMAISPNGKILASASNDKTVKLWDLENDCLIKTLMHDGIIRKVTWSPDGQIIAACKFGNNNYNVFGLGDELWLWDVVTFNKIKVIRGLRNDISWAPNGKLMASYTCEGIIRIWNVENWGRLREFKYNTKIIHLDWYMDSRQFYVLTDDGYVFIQDIRIEKNFYSKKLPGNKFTSSCMSCSPDRKKVALIRDSWSVYVFDIENWNVIQVLEGHAYNVSYVSFIDNGQLLVVLTQGGMLYLWETDSWNLLTTVKNISTIFPEFIAVHPKIPLIAVPAPKNAIKIMLIDLIDLKKEEAVNTVHYVNAKAVLVGDSGVGKSGLGIRMAEGIFKTTESTHGAQFWHLPVQDVQGIPSNINAELTIWDFAGQPEYRLVHQLFLDDADAAMLLFDCSDPDDPFHGVTYWAKVLKRNTPRHIIKFLVSARCDVSPVTVDEKQIHYALARYELKDYFKTSAKTNEGVNELYKNLLENIPWKKLPRTSTPFLFQSIKDYLLEIKSEGKPLVSMSEIRSNVRRKHRGESIKTQEIDAVVALLQARGLIYRLDPRPNISFILTRPELIHQYAASVIQKARNHPKGIGSVTERKVLLGQIKFSGFKRLPEKQEEKMVLEATVELLIQHDLCFREMGLLVFPSQINVTRPAPNEKNPPSEVAYKFSGSIETIYASLVVRLSHTNYFRLEDQWKYAVEFSRPEDRLGFSMRQVEEGTGELEIYFYPSITQQDRVTFIRFVTDHLHSKGINIKEEIRLYCPNCNNEVKNRDAIETRVKNGKMDITCQYCEAQVLIPQSVEELYNRDYHLVNKLQELFKNVGESKEIEIKQFKDDKQQYSQREDSRIQILHISDIHLKSKEEALIYYTQLVSDLKNLKVRRLGYIVITGDIANQATKDEYEAAFYMLNKLVNHFGLDSERVVITPGNHDLNWDDSENAYMFVSKRREPELIEGMYIPAGETGFLIRDGNLYQNRFSNFNLEFYKRLYRGSWDYPLDVDKQAIIVEHEDDKILFLALNSCAEIDHHFRDRAGINMLALHHGLDQVIEGNNYDGWLKIAVWHHPVTGKEMMNNDFMDLLAVNGFQICMHGHIHEAIDDFHKYDNEKGIHIIGAGTFGAPSEGRVEGIPFQYNLIIYDRKQNKIIVRTRKKEKVDGAWSADARWGDKEKPKPHYTLNLRSLIR